MNIYLAGPIFQMQDHECIHWRQEAKRRLNGFKVFDPMARDYRGKTNENYQKIVEEDKAFIDDCDILLVNYLKPSVGTSMEILYGWERKKHIIVVSENPETSPWLIYHADKICNSLTEAVEHINHANL